MSVLIKGMGMPKLYKTYKVRFVEDGGKIVVGFADENSAEYRPRGEAVPVSPHGRLIEDTAVQEQIDEWLDSVGNVVVGHGLSYYGELLGCIKDAPTIIDAEEEDNGN